MLKKSNFKINYKVRIFFCFNKQKKFFLLSYNFKTKKNLNILLLKKC